MKISTFSFPIRTLLLRNFATLKPAQALNSLPKLEITDGNILYMMMSVYIHGETLFARTIVRGRKAKVHIHLYDAVRSEMESKGLCIKPLGAGFMDVDSAGRTIKIYGKCKTFGRANHHRTREILSETDKYKDFKISVRR